MKKKVFFWGILAGILSGLALPAAEEIAMDFGASRWKLGKHVRLKDGIITVEVPDTPEKMKQHFAVCPIDLKPLYGQTVSFSIEAKGNDISTPAKFWNGGKVMLSFRDREGKMMWPGSSRISGSFDWREFGFSATIPEGATEGRLNLGLQQSSGKIEFRLDSLKVHQMFPRINRDHRAVYSGTLANTPPLRGVMSPHKFTEEDFRTLKAWNVNLVRAQITRRWGQFDTDQDLEEYDRWFDGKLAHLEQALQWAGKYGIKMIFDMHTPPGGRNRQREMTMFFKKKYADHYIRCWERVAKRFKGNPAVLGYDLLNEPVQQRRAPYDYWNIQRMAAEAIRGIDPDAVIIVESNLWAAPATFQYLSPLKMDNVIYQVHMYQPGAFTHQGVNNAFGEQGKRMLVRYPGTIGGTYWDRNALRRVLQPVRDFQLRHNARILVGEFSAIAWAPGAEQYLADCIAIFEEYGWDWTYHAFREWRGWSVEHAGPDSGHLVPSPDNPRRRVLLEAFQKNRPFPAEAVSGGERGAGERNSSGEVRRGN